MAGLKPSVCQFEGCGRCGLFQGSFYAFKSATNFPRTS
jgi:hypothetical protein